MRNKLIIPMIVSAQRFLNPTEVPALNPEYSSALTSYLGKDSTPSTFNKNITLKQGLHFHFILPSAFRRSDEVTDKNGNKTFEYTSVPDRFIITRMYVENGKIVTDCNVVESNFYSLDDKYQNSITIPKFDDFTPRERFRYMGRSYNAAESASAIKKGEKSGYFDRITAVAAGDPLFSVYYPNCSSVFGFHDELKGVPQDAILSYFVIGYYSNPDYDIFNNVKTVSDMQEALTKYNFSVDDNSIVCNSCLLFGEVSGFDLTSEYPINSSKIDIGIGKSSAEALSAIIKGLYYKNDHNAERFLTSLQYGTVEETSQIDGNFKIDDDIHYRGFSQIDALQKSYTLKLSKNMIENENLIHDYSNLNCFENEIGKMRRSLQERKNTLYYLWEIYESSASKGKPEIKTQMEPIIKEINKLRKNIRAKINDAQDMKISLEATLEFLKSELEITASEPFYFLKDPVVMLFGDGMKRTYAFGEEGRFEMDNSLFCLTKPLRSNIPENILLDCFKNLQCPCNDYIDYALTAILLDRGNILKKLGMNPVIAEKFSPIMINNDPLEQITLFMQWETTFYPNYDDSNPIKSKLEYGSTDYTYNGRKSNTMVLCDGVSILTPHGIYNLQKKISEYLEYHSEKKELLQLAEKIKDMTHVSQNLGGFNISLAALQHAFQFPIDIDPKIGSQTSDFSREIANLLEYSNNDFYELPIERLAVRNNTSIFPLREGFMDLPKLAIVSTFGIQRKLIDNDQKHTGLKYFSENLYELQDGCCPLPLAFTTASRLSANFVTAKNNKIISSPFPGATPVIGIFLPDMLNRNLNIFSNSGENIGTIKTAYRMKNGKKIPVARFVKSPYAPKSIDERITKFIISTTKDDNAFYEVMAAIDAKLNCTLSLAQNNYIFGRALVLAEICFEFEFFGAPEWSKKKDDIGKFDDCGLSKAKFPIMIGDRERVLDGVCCGFQNEFSQGFTAFGMENVNNQYLNADPLMISAAGGRKNVILLFDPMLKVTVNTGFLPVKQLEIHGEHSDFSKFELFTAELNSIISDEVNAELPKFTQNAVFKRLYPKIIDEKVVYEKINIIAPTDLIETIGKTIITDGIIVQEREDEHE